MASNSPITNGSLNFDDLKASAQGSIDQITADIQNTARGQPLTPAKPYNFHDGMFDQAADLVTLSSAKFNELFDELDFSRQYGYSMCIHSSDPNFQKKVYSFPINPQSVNISVPSTSTTTVTMKGIVEEHNGAPLRRISIRGTVGVLPLDMGANPGSAGPNSLLDSLLKNTFSTAIKVGNDAVNLANTVSSVFSGSSPLSSRINWSNTDILKATTGYEAAHTLYRFLDGYLAMKKQTQNNKLRLCFEMHKDKMYYDCTLNSFNMSKLPGTIEYEYSIELTAWRRQPTPPSVTIPLMGQDQSQVQGLNKLALITNALKQSRLLLSDSLNVLAGVRADVNQVFVEPLREAILLGGEIVGAVQTISAFPSSIINSVKAGIVSALKQADGTARLATIQASMVKAGYYSNDNDAPNYGLVNPSTSVLKSEFRETGDTTQAELNGVDNDASGFNLALNDPSVAIPMLDQFTVDEIPTTAAQQAAMQAEIDRVTQLTSTDLRNRRTQMESFANSIAQAFGGGNQTFDRVNGYSSKTTTKQLKVSDIILLAQINDAMMAYDSLILQMDNQVADGTEDYYSYYANVARENSIAFAENQSKFYVPFPYGSSLESVAVQYLGDAQRWIEIAALNGLQEPYIDEAGFQILFKGNGAGNSLILPNADSLFIGQTVQIGSSTQVTTPRRITSISVVSAVESVVNVDGDPTMGLYKTKDAAFIQAFLPNTINSLKMIAIPSSEGTGISNKIKVTPSPQDLDPIMLVAQNDLLLTSAGDLAVDSAGNVGIATGIQNLIQAAKLKLLTKAGSIISDPRWGNPVGPGDSTADSSSNDILQRLANVFSEDPRFGRILAGSVVKSGPSAEISLLIKVAGTNLNLPLVVQAPL